MEGVSVEAIAAGIENTRNIPGRLQRVENRRGLHVLVDYAHTPDALSNVLASIRDVARDARIICVFGCGGDRDRSKRPLMGLAVARGAIEARTPPVAILLTTSWPVSPLKRRRGVWWNLTGEGPSPRPWARRTPATWC